MVASCTSSRADARLTFPASQSFRLGVFEIVPVFSFCILCLVAFLLLSQIVFRYVR
ncbi:hypothetical protein IscW_ISCW009839 [Ixodes scapularis]|uniref:Uncharacterized protein n=1 Tax=Ixodes scapularis TaxID=6945 RepID=B7Q1B6_IXOSC|nr:hypothetical protein IscW_ISCW009839 [Ixodes scapularis]|eukprot:XP_002409293.1 hypothetical protein IscW_ISCW009839 [Ixodes scapularis]